MKQPIIDRRSFISSLALLALASCRKNTVIPEPPVDLGVYDITEFGDQLYKPPVDFTKIFHGYTDKISYKPGENVDLYLSGPPNGNQVITLRDINGNSVLTFNANIAFQTIGSSKPWVDGFMYKKTISIKLPDNLKSGFYRFDSDIPLICRGNDIAPQVTVVFPSNTYNAYNYYGGKSYYRPGDALGNAIYRATVVSFLRYNPVPAQSAANFNESFFQWIANQNYNTRFIADSDLENYAEIENSGIVIITGKSEYWTRKARTNIDKFTASGKNLLVFSGDTMYWQTRVNWKKNLMICYKNDGIDPLRDTPYNTYLWDSPDLKYPVTNSIGANFVGGGYPRKVANPLNGFLIAQDKSPLLNRTSLKTGDLLYLPTVETDGSPLKKIILPGSNEIPEIDNDQLKFYKVELIAYAFTINPDNIPGVGTFIAFKKTKDAGTVVNVASTNWCSATGIGGTDGAKIQTITQNMIELSLKHESLFSA